MVPNKKAFQLQVIPVAPESDCRLFKNVEWANIRVGTRRCETESITSSIPGSFSADSSSEEPPCILFAVAMIGKPARTTSVIFQPL